MDDTHNATHSAFEAKHQITERREVLEKPQEPSKENGKDDDELRNIAARFNRMDATLHKISGDSTARVPSC